MNLDLKFYRKRSSLFLLGLAILTGFNSIEKVSASQNELALGSNAKFKNSIDIPVNPMEEIDYKSQSEILNRRKMLVNSYPMLLKKQYSPSREVFGQLLSGKPWWGIIGTAVYGSGKHAIDGPSEETRFLYNPYLLVGTLPWSNEIWDEKKLNKDKLSNPDFPFCWKPSIIRYYPAKKMVQIAYEVSSFNDALKTYDDYITDKEPIVQFGLSAYNARDFGFNYLFIPIDKSKNITNTKDLKTPVKIQQFIHSGGSSGYPGGCNNMSPAQAEFDHLEITNLPATATIQLWKQNPGTVRKEADLTVLLELR